MIAIYKRELRGYFTTPIGYIYLGAFFAISGFYWFAGSLLYGSSDLSLLFSTLFTISAFLAPVLTMRLFTEEKRNKTDQLLLTSPVSLTGLVAGKFLSALTVYTIGILITIAYQIVMSFYGTVQWSTYLGNLLGLFLLGAAILAIGMFLSSLTENQVIAAVGGFGVALLLLLVDSLGSSVGSPWLQKATTAISFYEQYAEFTMGLVNLPSVVFFASVVFLFGFLTVRVLEKRRWS